MSTERGEGDPCPAVIDGTRCDGEFVQAAGEAPLVCSVCGLTPEEAADHV